MYLDYSGVFRWLPVAASIRKDLLQLTKHAVYFKYDYFLYRKTHRLFLSLLFCYSLNVSKIPTKSSFAKLLDAIPTFLAPGLILEVNFPPSRAFVSVDLRRLGTEKHKNKVRAQWFLKTIPRITEPYVKRSPSHPEVTSQRSRHKPNSAGCDIIDMAAVASL